MSIDLKKDIQTALQGFATGNLTGQSLKLFKTLGYKTDRQSPFGQKTFQCFKDSFLDGNNRFDEKKAFVSEWKYIDLLFQLSKEEMSAQVSLFDTGRVDNTVIESYLFFAIELEKSEYSRSALAQITREVNKVFPMPVMILFKLGQSLTLAVINRRLNKKDDRKDVLEKVTVIKDISISKPHRAHIEILFDLSFEELQQKYKFTNFVQLHNAWQKALDIKTLNKKFYDDIFKWYLWAVKNVRFPQIRPEADKISDQAHQSESVIRLLTRLLFCWFLKEKNQLIKDELFDQAYLFKMLNNFKGEQGSDSLYYRAILQNLFFATLSVPIKARKYIRESFQGKNKDYGNPYVFRYQEYFVDPKENLKLFKDIPFLNGGLFECLDTAPENDGAEEIRLDGFSSKQNKQAAAPDFLFWGEHKGIDISQDLDDKKKTNETVYGVIDILNAYKFTIEENTPLEEEIALDPELLGKVFENLLASYNPETKKTARKQTGSFYTPREIVDYMVDASLSAYFEQKFVVEGHAPSWPEGGATGRDETRPSMKQKDSTPGGPRSDVAEHEVVAGKIQSLLSYSDTHNPFNEHESEIILNAIDALKALDPACGSGAFPVGILNKLVWILKKIDPENKKWFEKIIARLPDYTQAEMRKKLADEDWNYLRKLGIIQQSIYGVDIQPIAIQIAKLRFFISLIVDQAITKEPDNNFGVQPLPNLDFKLVCADTLIGAPEEHKTIPGGLQFGEGEFFKSFNSLTAQYFSLSLPKDKQSLSKKIEALIRKKADEKIAEIKSLSTHEDARFNKHLEEKNKELIEQAQQDARLWESYKNIFKHGSVAFFDTRYFFPEVQKGFDIAIGNPPYVQIQSFSGRPEQKLWEKQKYETYTKTGDVYCLFYERGCRLLKSGGILTYITSNKWMRANYGKAMRKFFLTHGAIDQLIDFGDSPIFENATTYTNILVYRKDAQATSPKAWDLSSAYENHVSLEEMLLTQGVGDPLFTEDSFVIVKGELASIKKRIEEVGVPLKNWDIAINYGIKTGFNEAFIIDGKKKAELIAKDPKSSEILKPILRGRDIKRYKSEFADLWLVATHNGYNDHGKVADRVDVKRNYPAVWEHLNKINKAANGQAEKRCDQGNHWTNLRDCAYFDKFQNDKIVWPETSQNNQFCFVGKNFYLDKTAFFLPADNRFLLGLLNSKVAFFYLDTLVSKMRGGYFSMSKIYVEQLPLPQIPPREQAPYERLVDCILFAKEHGMNQEASTLEWVVDVMVYGLYFEAEMKKDHCYINDRIAEVIKPFTPNDTDEFKSEYIKTFVKFCNKDEVVYHGLVHSRNVKPVKIISGAKNKE